MMCNQQVTKVSRSTARLAELNLSTKSIDSIWLDYEFVFPSKAKMQSDGTLAILDTDNLIELFDADGAHTESIRTSVYGYVCVGTNAGNGLNPLIGL